MAFAPDTIVVAVPATWDVPGASAIPTVRNKNGTEGGLRALPADIEELLKAGMMLPGALFSAEGRYENGVRIGLRFGLYDTGTGDPIALVKDAVARLTPEASVSSTTICGQEAVRTLRRWDDPRGGAAICDYWGPLRQCPTSMLLLRFWRDGPGKPDAEEIIDNVAGSVHLAGGANWAGPLRHMMRRRYGPPSESEPHEPGRWRFIGWRLGTVFKSKMIAENEISIVTEMSVRRRDAVVLLVVWLAWIIAFLTLIGMNFALVLSAFPAMHAVTQLRSKGPKAVVTFAELLAGLFVFGVAIS
ncbi:MAG: hypothetical protein AB1679_06795 [Actinomycetota bacterium]